jgi:membrane peptidoglycan carboxypeptidase
MCIAFTGTIVGVAGIAYAMVGVPDPNAASKAQNNVYYWDDKTPMIATGGEVNRQIIPISQIPMAMQNAVISAENKTFRTDSGIDPMGITRALLNMAQGGQTQGGSTITQQYVKNSMLNQDQTVTRKFKELFISIKVGATKSKDDIMAGYLNTSYFGRGAYGLQAAARTYYDVNASDLNASQCAFLTSLLKGATYYDPAGATDIDSAATPQANRARSQWRWQWILDREVVDGNMTRAERSKWTTYPTPQPIKKNAQMGGQIGYLVDLAKGYFINNNKRGVTADQLAQGGYQIYTTFNKKKVDQLERAVKKVRKANELKSRPEDKYVQFGGASVNPSDGAIVAIYGGVNATQHFTNNADQTGAQVGSTFKPFVLAAAMTYGKRDPSGPESQPDYGQPGSQRTLVSPNSIYNGKNKLKIKKYDGTVWTDQNNNDWLQTNDDGDSPGPITLRQAMQNSVNSPYVQLGMDVGTDKVAKAAVGAGLLDTSLASSNFPSFSIGTSDPSAIRMASAYGTFAANGRQNNPFSVTKVLDNGEIVYQHKVATKAAFSTAVASNVTDVLKNVVEKGTGTAAQLPGREVGGKTGTTDGNKSAWFVGYTPQLSTAIDMYRLDDNANNKNRTFLEMYGTFGKPKIHGASFPAEIWHDYMAQALNGTTPVSFPAPEKLGTVVYGGGASSPTPTPSITASPSVTPSRTPSQIPTPTTWPTPSASDTCMQFFGCGWNGGTGGGPTPSPPPPGRSPSPTSGTGGFLTGGTG